MRPFSLLVKPSGPDCNLRCEYCFYLKKSELYPDARVHRMSPAVLEQMIRTFMQTDQPGHSIGWQGGEPTLMGLDFFKQVTALEKQYGRSGASVANGLQTNGMLLDDDWARHLAEYHFLLGVSLDGPPEIHDHYRHTVEGTGCHARVIRGIEALKRNQVDFNTLTLVSQANVRRAGEVYRYLVDQEFLFQQYIECVEFGPDGALRPWSISAEAWGEFLCALFDAWYPADTRRVSIRLFDTILALLVDRQPNTCAASRHCNHYFVVEHTGDVYPCDFFVEPEWRLGNVMTDAWEAMQGSERYRAFGANKAAWSEACAACAFLPYCAGDCPKHRYAAGRDPRQLSALCAGWKLFYAHTLERFHVLAGEIHAERRAAEVRRRKDRVRAMLASGTQVGRNDPCPCGSGAKFKKCCGTDS